MRHRAAVSILDEAPLRPFRSECGLTRDWVDGWRRLHPPFAELPKGGVRAGEKRRRAALASVGDDGSLTLAGGWRVCRAHVIRFIRLPEPPVDVSHEPEQMDLFGNEEEVA